jgi:hypothetical protein
LSNKSKAALILARNASKSSGAGAAAIKSLNGCPSILESADEPVQAPARVLLLAQVANPHTRTRIRHGRFVMCFAHALQKTAMQAHEIRNVPLQAARRRRALERKTIRKSLKMAPAPVLCPTTAAVMDGTN